MTEKNIELKPENKKEQNKDKLAYNEEESEQEILTPWKLMKRKFLKKKISVIGLILLIAMIVIVLAAPILAPRGPIEYDLTRKNEAPSEDYLLGTDELGRDYFARVLYGGKVSLKVGIFAVLIQVLVGALIGGLAGYYGGWVDNILMRFAEIVMSFPFMPLAITISAVLSGRVKGEQKMYIVMMIIGLLSWPGLSRMIRGQILSLREQEFILAAKALGIKDRKIIWRHLIPNTFGYIIVSATLGMAGAIMSEAGLSFLGLGVTPPVPTWGNLVQYARSLYNLQHRPWLWIPPGLCIFITVMSINLIGDGLRDAIDPKSR